MTLQDRFQLVLYVSLVGTGLVCADGSFKIQRLNAFHRDLIVRLVKKTLKEFLKNLSFGEVPIKPIQVVTAIEDYIRFRQSQQIAGIKD
jgi:hypothetical protein